jgi:hypothetical protein
MTVPFAPRPPYVKLIHVAPKLTTLKRPLALMVATLESPTCHLPIFVTSLVVLSLRVAVPVSCEVSPTDVNARLPLIERPVTVAEGLGVGVVGVGFSPPQFVHVGVRRVSSKTPSLLLEHRMDWEDEDG